MDVDVHRVERHVDEQVHLGAALLDRRDAVGVDDRVRDRAVLHHAPVDEHVLRPARWSLLRQRGHEPDNLDVAAVAADVDQVAAFAVQLVEPVTECRDGRALEHLAARADEREPDLRVAQRELRDDAGDLRRFGGIRLQELPARGQVVKEVGDGNRRPFTHAGLGHRGHRAAVEAHLRAGLAAPRARAEREMRDRRDAGERLAPEAERGNAPQVVRAADLARRMPLDGQPRVLRRHPFPVVLDLDQLLAAQLHRNRDAAGAGIDCVLDQFLDHGCGPLDDFTGGNLVGEVGRQQVNLRHRVRSSASSGTRPA